MKQFNFIPAFRFDELFNDCIFWVFFGSSTGYYELNGIKYIISEGCHIATKSGKKIIYNPNFEAITTVKQSIKKI
jgi:hypothetical protein